MKLLILGGTRFVGRWIVEAALAAEHEVTLFHRGRHESEFADRVETLHGDRSGDLTALQGRRWDAAIDTSGYTYRAVRDSAELLHTQVEHYTFISTISVYADFTQRGLDEESEVHRADRTSTEVTGETYGPMKVACEEAVREIVPERHLIIRPGIIAGPHDYTDRFTYWCRRVAEGGEVLAPGEPDRPVQIIDVRDLAEWIVRLTTEQRTGTFNAAGPALPLTLQGMLEGIRLAADSDASFTWVPEDFLRRHGSDPKRDFPLYIPEDATGVFSVENRRAIEAGLTFRPFDETVQDTLAWDRAEQTDADRKAGISREREKELLRAWRETESA